MSEAPTKVLSLSGSQRKQSYNRWLVDIAAEGARQAGAVVTTVEWEDYVMPLYDHDIGDAEVPEAVHRFKKLLLTHDGLLIASPEYNVSVTPLLKNAIDWASRPSPGESTYACFRDKVVGLLSVSTGSFGGAAGLQHLRAILSRLGALVLPEQYPVGEAKRIFDAQGQLNDPSQRAAALAIGARVTAVARHWKWSHA